MRPAIIRHITTAARHNTHHTQVFFFLYKVEVDSGILFFVLYKI